MGVLLFTAACILLGLFIIMMHTGYTAPVKSFFSILGTLIITVIIVAILFTIVPHGSAIYKNAPIWSYNDEYYYARYYDSYVLKIPDDNTLYKVKSAKDCLYWMNEMGLPEKVIKSFVDGINSHNEKAAKYPIKKKELADKYGLRR